MSTQLAIVAALAAAVVWALNMHIQRKALDTTDPLLGAFLSVSAVAGVCWLASPWLLDWSWWMTPAAALFAVTGLLFPGLGQTLQVYSVARVGATLTASLGALTPAFAVLIGISILGERMTLPAALGLALTIFGLICATWTRRGKPRAFPLWAIALPLAAALARGIAQPGLKVGLEDVPSPYFALLAASSAATLLLGSIVCLSRPAALGTWHGGNAWFLLTGVINGVGILALNFALKHGPLVIVSPLAATVPLWSLLFGLTIFRREALGLQHVVVAFLIVSGCIMLVAN
ncbi:DMT family transporter [Maritimibacter sp. UBA3975]|uniref:DMT family transporter n=1 Tax=Maritimibacter sp. UBA3975 TaxID=1946833 RepID=UPI000C0AA339|nr:DMT family transporter [Maritimibacter sp. UBA3975]MAM62237.1 hypothetical protein [Maritimibacter sp.]|tara:strand:- start:14716 stop:15582 length:867 start_codon:yes stop_codon:yes gene_type:complete